MTIKVGINGYGRIGRNMLRALYESDKQSEIEIVAVNDLGDANTNAHLTRRDTAHGRFPGTISVDGDYMVVNGDKILVCAERDPAKLPWGDLGVDLVLESTGLFASKEKASAHLEAGARKVGRRPTDKAEGRCQHGPFTQPAHAAVKRGRKTHPPGQPPDRRQAGNPQAFAIAYPASRHKQTVRQRSNHQGSQQDHDLAPGLGHDVQMQSRYHGDDHGSYPGHTVGSAEYTAQPAGLKSKEIDGGFKHYSRSA